MIVDMIIDDFDFDDDDFGFDDDDTSDHYSDSDGFDDEYGSDNSSNITSRSGGGSSALFARIFLMIGILLTISGVLLTVITGGFGALLPSF